MWQEAEKLLARYSWSLEYYFSMKYCKFSRLQKAATDNIFEENRQSFLPNVFAFWLEHVNGSSTSAPSFAKLCIDLGLMDAEKTSEVSRKTEAKNAIERAEKIIQLDKKRIQRK